MGTIASKDCERQQCPGTAMFEISCKQYVCMRCGHHNQGPCVICDWDPADEEHFTEDPEETMRGTQYAIALSFC